ncbi:MAG: T9SS type A sorting domain-containing protein [Bacteroidales bacterium]|nr:T9SS type A sorting domain-containing protein [Bacteroidales bacterium]
MKNIEKKYYGLIIIALFVLVFSIILIPGKDLKTNSNPRSITPGYDKPEGYYEFFRRISTPIGADESGYKTNYRYEELQKALEANPFEKSGKSIFNWTHRGPGNVGGRTRKVIIDPDDPTNMTWFAAAASGGVWKTTDGGESWQHLTDQLSNLATNAIAMASSNHNVLYIGTGEGYGGFGMVNGSGMYRSNDKGTSWIPIDTTIQDENFKWINQIIVNENDEDIVLAATNSGIFRSVNGGLTWDTAYFTGHAVQDIAVNPLDCNTLYAGVNKWGIIKSYNQGIKWFDVNEGIATGSRFSVTVSPVDTNFIYTNVEAPDLETHVYASDDGAQSWKKLNDYNQTFIHFLGVQGWFNNIIKAHPFSKNKVFIGGVDLGCIEFKNTTNVSEPQVLRTDTFGTASFMGFVNFGGISLGGGMSTGIDEEADIEEEDFTSIKILFGPEKSQKAHRFIVPEGEGPGVPPEDYTYMDYIEVDFEVWDTDNNRQLMVSFRDQERDGEFNLIKREYGDDISGREYLFVHAMEYKNDPDPEISMDGGHYHKMMYFFWPTLGEDLETMPDVIPESRIHVKYGSLLLQDANTTILADASRNTQLHVDHHDLHFIITDEENEKFSILDANDGGFGFSSDQGNTWKQINKGYLTTQFYGVAKKPGSHEYIGGMQDNGTWQSPIGEIASAGSEYESRVEGDGFECLWHPLYPHRILASSYYNLFKVSNDGGKTWSSATNGIIGDGPFLSRLSHSPNNPDLVFAVGNWGVYRHTNFCIGRYDWELIEIDDGWAIDDQVTSSHSVEVSLADEKIVWAGAGMYKNPDLSVFLSKNYGKTFEPVNLYDEWEMGYITSIATHPTDPATAYLLFSMNKRPKILRTEDFGETWEDITGFEKTDSTSHNGFQDIMVYSLLVFPYNTDIIWAGTEIGIFESTDNGVSWHLANTGLPSVSVWQMFIQDNTLVVATHGRGIWTAPQYPGAVEESEMQEILHIQTYPNPSYGIVHLEFESNDFGNVNVVVYNLKGEDVYQNNFVKNSSMFHESLDLETLFAGSYILFVELDGNVFVSKLILN